MNLFDENDIDYPRVVTVKRPTGGFSVSGNYIDAMETVIESMTADIQLSLKVRNLVRHTKTGAEDTTAWIMFCRPPCPILTGDAVEDGERRFTVESSCDWGTHTECVMRRVTHPA